MTAVSITFDYLSFEVKGGGPVLDIVRRTGAGNSVPPKILNRIEGLIERLLFLRDRIARPLEVGTGFHLELTEHENVSLDGAVLGLSALRSGGVSTRLLRLLQEEANGFGRLKAQKQLLTFRTALKANQNKNCSVGMVARRTKAA
jgi:hypothetical protein